MLAPRHPAVATLPRAYRTPLHLRSCIGRLEEAIRFFGWLRRRGISDLGTDRHAGLRGIPGFPALPHRRGRHRRRRAEPSVRRAAAQVIVDLVNYRELFTADRVRGRPAPLGRRRPPRRSPRCRRGRTQNKTQPVAEEVLQPMLAAALLPGRRCSARTLPNWTASTPGRSRLFGQGRRAAPRRPDSRRGRQEAPGTGLPAAGTAAADARGPPRRQRIAAGWPADDPLLPVGHRGPGPAGRPQPALGLPACRRCEARCRTPSRQQGCRRPSPGTRPRPRPRTAAAHAVDLAAATVRQAVALVGIVRTAAIIVVAAASGMRASELMELRVGCRRPAENRPWPAALSGSPARSSRASRSAAPTMSGSSSNRSTAPSSSPSSCTTTRATASPCSGASTSPSAAPGSGTGSTPRRAAARARPDPGRPGEPQDAEPDPGPGDGLPARRGASLQDPPEARRRRHDRRLCLPPRRRAGQAAGRGQQA